MDLQVISRAGCHLCEDMVRSLVELGFRPVVTDVDQDPELQLAYDFRVPVLLLAGDVIAEGPTSKDRLAALLSKWDASTSGPV